MTPNTGAALVAPATEALGPTHRSAIVEVMSDLLLPESSSLQPSTIQPWMVSRLPSLYVDEARLPALRFHHVCSTVTAVEPAPFVWKQGQTVWQAQSVDRQGIYLAWDWALIAPWTMVLADPMSIASNLCPVDAQGLVPVQLRLAVWTRLIAGIDWPETVREHVGDMIGT